MQYIQEAVEDGARVKKACETVCISYRSFIRWRAGKLTDNRKGAAKHVPRRLTEQERERFFAVANERRFRDMSAAQIVPTLLQEGIYIGSESTLQRILRDRKANIRRSESRMPRSRKRPPGLVATGPNQVWSWDITWLKTEVKGIFLYAYVIIDVFSRKIVGWTIQDSEDPEYARDLFNRAILSEGCVPRFVHADNGGPMRGVTLQVFLQNLHVRLSYNRARVSNDNAYSESWFGTMKGHVSYPKFFTTRTVAMQWFAQFVHRYNTIHMHSAIGYVTPQQRHSGRHKAILLRRHRTLCKAAQEHPERFVNGPRRMPFISKVYLNCKPPQVA